MVNVVELSEKYCDYFKAIILLRWKVNEEKASEYVNFYLNKSENTIAYILLCNNTPIGCGIFDTKCNIKKYQHIKSWLYLFRYIKSFKLSQKNGLENF